MMSNDLLALRPSKLHPTTFENERIPDMQNDFESKEWAENRQAFSENVAGLFASIINGLDRLQALTFDAPWKIERPDCKCTGL